MDGEDVSRRRYISTKISLDKTVNQIAKDHGDFVALFYTWGIPHAEEDATLYGDIDELLALVMPMRRDKTADDIETAVVTLADAGLLLWDKPAKTLQYPVASFYEYQTNIASDRRRVVDICNDYPHSAENGTQQHRTPRKRVSSSSFSSSISSSNTYTRDFEYDADFSTFWSTYPRKVNKRGSFRNWSARLKERVSVDELLTCGKNYARYTAFTEERYIMHPATFLGPNERWKEHIIECAPSPSVPPLRYTPRAPRVINEFEE